MEFPSPGAERIARAMHDGGPTTASALAQRLGLSGAVVRRHLDSLISAGLAECSFRPPYGPTPELRRGRPARVFSLTDQGQHAFDVAYDDLAVSALRFMATTQGPTAVSEFAESRAAEWAGTHADTFAGLGQDDIDARIELLAEILAAEGFAASLADPSGGSATPPTLVGATQICQHHCPVAHVAAEFPQLCEAETHAFERLLGTHVMRIATIAHGDGVCTTLVPGSTRRKPAQLNESTALAVSAQSASAPSGTTQRRSHA